MSKWLYLLVSLLALTSPVFSLDYDESEPVDALTGEWEGFHYEEMGMTQWEFQQIREAGISREKLMNLLELGVRASEYLQKPWTALGVTEEQWLKERANGMEDSDIDRSYRNKAKNQDLAFWSLLVPSLYQWKTGKYSQAISMDAIWLASVAFGTFLFIDTKEADEVYLIPFILGVHIWSFADAFLDTRWENNPDANRFSWGILPMPNGGVVGAMGFRF